MGRKATTARGNIYFECRKLAAIEDARLGSRERTAELLNLSPSTLADYELGKTKAIPIENVMRMAELYKAPWLMTRFCSKECPLGTKCKVDLPVSQPSIKDIALKLAANTKARSVETMRDDVIEIAIDGKVSEDERQRLGIIIRGLEEIARSAVGLRLVKAASR